MHTKRLALLLSICAAFALWAPAASFAADRPVDCTGGNDSALQDALDNADPGDTVTLAQGTTCHSDAVGGYDMNNNGGVPITVQGAGSGATIDGGGTDYGLDGTDVGASTIRNLTIQNTSVDFDGAGLEFDGDSPVTIADNRFLNNHATDGGDGGGLLIDSSSGDTVTLRGNTFGGNGATDGNTARDGGGALIESDDGADLDSSGNRFIKNSASGTGGGMLVRDMSLKSTNDRFVGNTVETAQGGEGGGLAIVSSSGAAEARNLVAAGNKVLSPPPPSRVATEALEPSGEGGGIYFGGRVGNELRVLDSTVVSNQAANGSGIDGGSCDALTLYNGIVHDNTGGEEISGFDGSECGIIFERRASATGDPGTRDVQFTDTCVDDSPHPGDGNICADPLLADGPNGDVHQTSNSPTLNKGSNALVPSDLTQDWEGDARIGFGTVDMGADEVVPAVVQPTQPTQPAALGCLNAGGNVNGRNLGPARLGRNRTAQRAIFKGAMLRTRLGLDKYCAVPRGWFRIGYPNARLNRSFGRSVRRRIANNVVLILTSSPRFTLLGIKRNDSQASAKRRLHGERSVIVGKNHWYVVRASGRRLFLVKVQGGKVREIGLGDGSLAASRTLLKRYLRAWEGGL